METILDVSGDELLRLCRKPTFHDSINNQIDREIALLIEQIPVEPLEDEILAKELAENANHTLILDKLWILKNSFIEIESFIDMQEYYMALTAIEKLRRANNEFSLKYPDTLLCADIDSRLIHVRDNLYKDVASLWESEVQILHMETDITLRVKPSLAEHWDLYVECEQRLNLIETFMQGFSNMTDQIIKLQVDDVGETDTSASLGLGETKSVEMLIYNVQTFTLALSSVLPPPLYAMVTKRFGHSLVRTLTKISLPGLSPKDPSHLENFRAEIQGLKGLQELLVSINWFNAHLLSDYADNFTTIWKSQTEGEYLGKLRKALSGKFAIQSDGWDWDGEEDDDEADDDDAFPEEDEERELPIVIVSSFVHETQANIDKFITLFRALTPKYYGDHLIEMYAAVREFHAQIRSLPYSANEYTKLQEFGILNLNIAVEKYSMSIDAITRQPLSPNLASKVLTEIESIAKKSTAAGPQVKDDILSTLVEQVAVNAIKAVLALGDITTDQGAQISEYIQGLRGAGAYFQDINDAVPSWIKLQRLQQIMNQNLIGIRGMYENSMLIDFSSQELTQLIEALFVDSDQRQELIYLVN